MHLDRFNSLTAKYPALRLAVIGDYCLDRYLEIDPSREEKSIETGLPVHNVVNVRAQAGGAGTVLNNLAALGVGTLRVIGFSGDDGEGYELRRALAATPGVRLEHFFTSPERRTFTYCKPLVLQPGQEPRELSRLDSKNHSPTPEPLARELARSLHAVIGEVDAVVVMEQVDQPETGVISGAVRGALRQISGNDPIFPILADSRLGLSRYPPVFKKMNLAELRGLFPWAKTRSVEEVEFAARLLADETARPVFVTLAERGIVGADPTGDSAHVPALPVRGPIDVVGAGDAVTANLAAALAAGASHVEAMELAMVAAHLVVHQLGTTGTATVPQISECLAAAGVLKAD